MKQRTRISVFKVETKSFFDNSDDLILVELFQKATN